MAFSSTARNRSRTLLTAATSASALGLSVAVYTYIRQPVKNDDLDSQPLSSVEPILKKPSSATAAVWNGAGHHSVYVWGSNKNSTLLPSPSPPILKTPKPTPFTANTPLRDLLLAENFGAAVDARGDVWMWGEGYESSSAVESESEKGRVAGRSLRGKKISSVQSTTSKLFALSHHSGKIFVTPTSKSLQSQYEVSYPWWYLGLGRWLGSDPGVDFVELSVGLEKLGKGEKFSAISAGKDHLLALTNKGRTFSMPTSPLGNSHSQLGIRSTGTPLTLSSTSTTLSPDQDIRYSTTLSPIPSLSSIPICQIATGSRHSLVRTLGSNRILGFGANEFGQLGLGSTVSVEIIPTPTEVVIARQYKGGTSINCTDLKAAGNNTFFTVERQDPKEQGRTYVDLLAAGSGISGTLGNGLWSSANGNPTRVKTVSGLQEYSEKAQAFLPCPIYAVSLSSAPSQHAFATLHTSAQADPAGVLKGLYGNDVWSWGASTDYQLGNGRRSNQAIPQHLAPLPRSSSATNGSTTGTGAVIDAGGVEGDEVKEASWSSGTLSPMPHSRLQLHFGKADAFDLEGKLIKRKVKVEETILAGWNASAVYWKIVD